VPGLNILLVGDIILDEPDPDTFFDRTRPMLESADVVVGHVEVPHTRRGYETSTDVPAPPADPAHLQALGRAGFDIITLAGNHICDSGPAGIEDTIAELRVQGIGTAGAGSNVSEARKPAVGVYNGWRVGVLSFNCVGPREAWATGSKAGCAYVEVITHYELGYASPGGPPGKTYSFADPGSLEQMQADIESLRGAVDVLVVALHKGLGHTPATLAMYERPLSKAAIDAGADIVVGHHAHILQGVEIYKGRPIYHGLGNFVTVTKALSVEDNPSPARRQWARRRRELFGFEPDPDYPNYPFHPHAKNAMIAACRVDRDGGISAGLLPCWIQPTGQPEVLTRGELGMSVAAYIEEITRTSQLKAKFFWEGDRVVFQ